MDSIDDTLLAESEESQSDHETDESSESSSHKVQNDNILILSTESLSCAGGGKYVLPPELDLKSLKAVTKAELNNITSANAGNPIVIKAQPISGSQYILLPHSTTFPISDEQNRIEIENVFYSCDEKNSDKKKSKERVRERNVTPAEKRILFRICEKYPVIDTKDCNNEAIQRKRKAWEIIHKEFIAVCPESSDRSIKFLQGCWSRFKKEMRRRKRRAARGESESVAPSLGETESDLIDHCSDSRRTASPGNTVLQNNENPLNAEIADEVLTTEPHDSSATSNSRLIPPDSCVVLSAGKSVSGEEVYLRNTNDSALCNDDSGVSGAKTVFSKSDISKTAAVSEVRSNPRLHSEFRTRPVSTRSLRRRALELALEVEKEKLLASKYRREAEQERLAAMKLQKSAQRFALMVEKERYETELLKKEAARLSLEKLS